MSQKPPHPQHTAELPLSDAWRALSALCVGFYDPSGSNHCCGGNTTLPQRSRRLPERRHLGHLCLPPHFCGTAAGDRAAGGTAFGQRTIYLIGMVVFTLSSLACGLASTIELLIIARALQGFGASLIAPQTMSVINRIFPRDKRGAAMGMWGAVAGFASLMGPLLGGVIVAYVGVAVDFLYQRAHWRGVAGAGGAVGSSASQGVEKHRCPQRCCLSNLRVRFCVHPTRGAAPGGGPCGCGGLLAAGVGAFAWFVWLQYTAARRGTEPLVPLVMFRNRNFALGSFSISAMGFVVGGTMVPIMLFLQDVQGMNAQQAAFMLIPMAVISGTLAPFVGRLADRIHPRVLSMIGFGFMTAAALALAAIMRDGVGRWWMLLPAMLLGFGNGFVWSPKLGDVHA